MRLIVGAGYDIPLAYPRRLVGNLVGNVVLEVGFGWRAGRAGGVPDLG